MSTPECALSRRVSLRGEGDGRAVNIRAFRRRRAAGRIGLKSQEISAT